MPSRFPAGLKVVRDANVELLGGPIGVPELCDQRMQGRVTKALRVLQALGKVPGPQMSFQLLRRCAAFSKIVFSLRVVPASFHSEAPATFDAQVRACLEQFTFLHPDGDQ